MVSNPDKILLVLFFFSCFGNVYSKPRVFSVMNFGAKGDGKTDDAKALLAAWTQACGTTTKSKVLIPKGVFLARGAVIFKGPCESQIEFQLDGTVIAPPDMAGMEDWIAFRYINGLKVSGTGAFDGKGTTAWSQNQCSNKEVGGKCRFPVSLRFNFVKDATITGISSINSKYFHIHLLGCNNIKFQNVKLTAPRTSANTDGIHIADSTGVEISGSTIGTGDDCISMGPGAANINITGVTCGPGHGISVGSLGKKNAKEEQSVTGVVVKNCTFIGTDNGVRVKTWPSGTAGKAFNFTFDDIIMYNVKNPIVIDQEYCPYNSCDKRSPSLVKISQVKFNNIRGSSATKDAVTLKCSEGIPCEGVKLSDINLKYHGADGGATSICTNAKAALATNVFPPTCTNHLHSFVYRRSWKGFMSSAEDP
ncbi:galacturonan 1,4-alpha-galacturonidase [Ranunculus cassubicifolius]